MADELTPDEVAALADSLAGAAPEGDGISQIVANLGIGDGNDGED
jgi:hypothetical protein